MTTAFVREVDAPKLPPPAGVASLWAVWRDRVAPTPLSAVASLIIAALLVWIFWTLFSWAIVRAVWSAPDREACSVLGAGACWPFAKVRFMQWIYGLYPIDQRWRPNIVFLLGGLSLAGLMIPRIPGKLWNGLFFFLVFPFLTAGLLLGGFAGLSFVETTSWGGFLVTLILSLTSIAISLPLGVALALGRQSKLPVLKLLCTVFIEAVRGVPLVLVLFMAVNMLPLFLPPGLIPNKFAVVLVGVLLFFSAYMAEVVRGGLQAIPKGQFEAANALGLHYWKLMSFIILPQALKIVIPSIVNNYIGVLQNTTLVLVVGIFDLLNMVQSGFNDATWASPQTGNTGYFSLAVIYWIICFAISRYSLYIERRLNVGQKR
jgi:general L-amino acid transport system permease protein